MILKKSRSRGEATIRVTALAASIYLGMAVVFFGVPVLHDPTHYFIGAGQDPSGYMWCLVWWPYAIAHRLNPLFTRVIWVPSGANLAWAASIPGPSLFMSPLTRYVGPVASFNLLTVAAPATAALTAFLVCNHLSAKFGPALVGGYLFGFSSYELGQELSDLSLSIVFCIPLALYLVLLKIEKRISSRFFVALYSIVLTAQFATSTEIFAGLPYSQRWQSALQLFCYRRFKERRCCWQRAKSRWHMGSALSWCRPFFIMRSKAASRG